ncbi:MAG: hypothetical protein A2Z73_01560 [Deltaproteobacteria bacterium RBG_13_60_28]|nr:MAG: hypothetical protein A2Z73_01560 [Deltaproteobacteria bacterium RBG_13_60_28]
MGFILDIKNRLTGYLAKLIKAEVQKAIYDELPILAQLIDFHNSPEKDRQHYYDHTKNPLGNLEYYESLKDRLLGIGVPVEAVDIDIPDFEKWLISFPEIKSHYTKCGDVCIEKCLEHFLSFIFLKMTKNDIFIDIAAAGSPWADILNRRGIRSYRLDLIYPQGIHGIDIGADAADTKLPDNFASILSLQCAFECFMGDADIGLLREASRILNERGRYAITPLYLDDHHFVATSPFCDQRDIVIEDGAKKVWRDDGYQVPFSRHYSPESFYQRIYSNIPDDMEGKILYFKNLKDIMEYFPNQRIYCFFMFYCEKKFANLVA